MRNRCLRAFQPLLAGLAVISSTLVFVGCEGSVTAPGGGASTSTGSGGSSATGTGNGKGSGGTGTAGSGGVTGTTTGGDPSATPGSLNAPYTRLTRAEYQATIKAAYNVDAVVTGIPDDSRVGPFTSNVPSADPVQEFLLASEDLAAAIVPAKLPTCTAATAAKCVPASYQAPIERLYRRALTPAEVTALANIVVSLEGGGLTSQDATRAMVVSTLMSANFLFRSTPLSGDAARGRRLSEHLGYALWDAPPDADLTTAGKSAPADLGANLKKQAARLAADPRAVPVLARFLGQWLMVDIDNKLTDPDINFATSPLYAELQTFVKNALTTNMTVKSFANGTQGFIQKGNFAAYGMTPATTTTDVVPVTWNTSTIRRGILGEELFLDATRHPDQSRRPIFRGHLIRSAFLCQPIASPPNNAVDLNSEVTDRTTDMRCAACHQLMDPIGKAFATLDLDNTQGTAAPVVNGPGEVTGTFASLPALLDTISGSQAFADCFSRNLLGFFLDQSPDAVDSAAVGDLSAVVKSGGTLADALAQAMVSLEKRSQSTTPWCSAQ